MMQALLAAGSPVEIAAKADQAGLSAPERAAALSLFHDLTSRLELRLLESPADGGDGWPRHRFWCGPADLVDAAVARLRADPDAAEPPATAAIEFVTAASGGLSGLLAAGSRHDWLRSLDDLG